MRIICGALMLVAGLVSAAEPAGRFDQAQFEKRFRQADKGNKGKLSREEAYAEFPRMPKFFDEIDANRDGFITLNEVNRALERRVDAAMEARSVARRYGSAAIDAAGAAPANAASPEQTPQFSSKAEARRYYRLEYYESVAGSNEQARQRGEPTTDSQGGTLLKKSF